VTIVVGMSRTVWLGALWLGLGACGQDDSAPSSQFGIEGRVLDDLTGAGVEHADVHFSSDTLDRADVTADLDGKFMLDVSVREGVEFGIIHAERDGYEAGAARTIYFDGTTHVITLRLREKSKAK
jgi:hypothetical protein